MGIYQLENFTQGNKKIIDMNEENCRDMMDFSLCRLASGQSEALPDNLETACLLMSGEMDIQWGSQSARIKRNSFWEEDPWCLHVPAGVKITVTGVSENAEIAVFSTKNSNQFSAKLYSPEECASENRGKGTMGETSTRIVRTIFDYSNAPWSNLVLGEVITFPGKWSSYPPHHHKQPEIYHYRFFPENGYGFCQLGENANMVKNGDTVEIVMDESHPQVAAPGYAMYYIWAIRHLDNNPYIKPVFEPEHLWVTSSDAVIWPDKKK